MCAVDTAPTAWGDAEARRRDILRSAETLLDAEGYAGLTMRAIAVGAGVSSGTVYQYFDGKEDVFVALMAEPAGGGARHARRAGPRRRRSRGC